MLFGLFSRSSRQLASGVSRRLVVIVIARKRRDAELRRTRWCNTRLKVNYRLVYSTANGLPSEKKKEK